MWGGGWFKFKGFLSVFQVSVLFYLIFLLYYSYIKYRDNIVYEFCVVVSCFIQNIHSWYLDCYAKEENWCYTQGFERPLKTKHTDNPDWNILEIKYHWLRASWAAANLLFIERDALVYNFCASYQSDFFFAPLRRIFLWLLYDDISLHLSFQTNRCTEGKPLI